MRRKKHKHTRRSVSFYKINHGFREPFKVLLDGNFIHATQAANMPHLQELLMRLLGAEVKLFTTPCVGKELRSLGTDFAAAAQFARGQQLHKCTHNPVVEPSECLLDAVAGGNPAHWLIATQDKVLQAELEGLQGVPLLFASVNGLHLAEPPEQARAVVAQQQATAQALPKHELKTDVLKDLHELRPKDDGWKKFRRKKTKGPNPLAVRQKKPKWPGVDVATAVAGPADVATNNAKASRHRRRRKHSQATAAAREPDT